MSPEFLSQSIIIIGLLLILSELFIGIEAGFDLVLAGIALMISGAVGLWIGSFEVTLLLSVLFFSLYILFGRKIIQQKITAYAGNHMNVDRLIGTTARVISPISPSEAGRVQIGDEEWRATSAQSFAKGDRATVLHVEGVSVVVTTPSNEKSTK